MIEARIAARFLAFGAATAVIVAAAMSPPAGHRAAACNVSPAIG